MKVSYRSLVLYVAGLLALVLAFAGCAHSDSWRVASAQNRRAYYLHEKRTACVAPAPRVDCAAADAALKSWDAHEGLAIDALARKGAITLQLRALKRDERAVRAAGVK